MVAPARTGIKPEPLGGPGPAEAWAAGSVTGRPNGPPGGAPSGPSVPPEPAR